MFTAYSIWLVFQHLLLFTLWSIRLGFNRAPPSVFQKRVIVKTRFISFRYIGWKPGRKFRSRIRMDSSAVCTRDTTPRTEVGLKCGFTFLPCLINFFIVWFVSLLFMYLHNFYYCLTCSFYV